MLSQKSIQIIKSTVPLLEKYGVEITRLFYKNMFEAQPQLLNIFNHSNQRNQKQPVALANTILQSAIHIEKLNEINLMPIVHKHVALGITPEMYPIVGAHLLGAMKIVMQDEATPEIMAAWTEAYRAVAQAFMDAEEDLYFETEEQIGGWKDTREFVVDRIEEETPLIKSFYFKPLDCKEIATYIPGQYITVKITLQGDGVDVPTDKMRTYVRHYSLSDKPNDEHYRISVKKELGKNNTPNGIVSNHFHNVIKVGDIVPMSVPAGDFVVDNDSETPILLICGGVGINPLFSMLKETLVQQPDRKINFIFCTHSESTQPFKEELKQLEDDYKETGNLKINLVYSENQGHINKEIIEKYSTINVDESEIAETDVYICGPVPFMMQVNKDLLKLGYHKENVHYELFGPLTPVLEENQMLRGVKNIIEN
ncbi:hypothetical protein RB653_003879 [Dictyostelium firmibasis]|uniref:nitric oxide dioxygenase n=1 Tax=Dictyostelium firmibasis TaxID=79012 RepID=A0AAN7U6G8_9MYCE